MKFGQLPTLQAVVRRGNFAAAAYEIGLTPSAVSQQMQQLEQYFGRPLFDRSGRSVRATSFAHEVLSAVDSALSAVEALRDQRHPQVSGKLRVGATNSVQLSHMPACLRAVINRFPALDITLEPGNSSDKLLQALSASDIDAAVVAAPIGGVTRKMIADELTLEPFVLVYPRSHKGGNGIKSLSLELPWIRYNANVPGGKMAAAFIKKQVPGLVPKYDVISREVVVAMVSEGLGFSVVPQPLPGMLYGRSLNVISLERRMPKRSIVLARRASDADNRRINALLACLREVYGSPTAT